MRTPADLTRLIKGSGFPLQAAIDHLLSSQPDGAGWKVLYREHGWTSSDGETKFIDLVLEDRHRTSVLVLECKRVLEADWLFLNSTGTFPKTLDARIWISNQGQDGNGHFGYYDARFGPGSEKAMFCVVPGHDGKSKPMLERTAAETLAALEGLAKEERAVASSRRFGLRMYAPIIVTTAILHVSKFDPAEISLETGEPTAVQHEQVPWIRFRKQFSSEFAVQPRNLDWNAEELGLAKEKEVFVVNAKALPSFLKEWGVISDSLRSLQR